jgi:hypothetical protein
MPAVRRRVFSAPRCCISTQSKAFFLTPTGCTPPSVVCKQRGRGTTKPFPPTPPASGSASRSG